MQKDLPYIIIAFGIAILFILLSILDIYDPVENKLLDVRFNQRGRIETRNDIATLDIDARSLQDEGRYPWNREKHVPMIKAAQEHDMSAIAFDMFFIERSERELDIKDLSSVQDTILSLDEVRDLFPDSDNELASAAGEAGNVYFAQAFFPQPKKKMPVKKRTDVKHSRLMELKDKGFFSIVDPDDFSTLFDFYDIEPPIEELIENSKGTYLFQTVADPDGVRRKYPLIGIYENRLFPSIALAMALDHFGVSFESIDIRPGKYVFIPLPEPYSDGLSSISIPIDKRGLMQVNWAGDWENNEGQYDIPHYPYWILKKYQQTEYSNHVLARVKELTNSNPEIKGNIKAIFKTAVEKKIAGKKFILNAVKGLAQSIQMENYIQNYPPTKTGRDFFTSINKKPIPAMLSLFNEIKNANIIADVFTLEGMADIDELIKSEKLLYELPWNDYQFSSLRKLQDDLEIAINKTTDETDRKLYNRSKAQLSQIERNFLIVQNLYRNNKIEEQRPLFFFPNPDRITVGNPNKKTDRMIVPFEFYGKKLFYGLTAAGTHDLNPQPFSESYPMVGLHANALNTILDNIFIHETPKFLVCIILALVGVFLAFGVPKLSPVMGGIAVILIMGIYTLSGFWVFSSFNIWLDLFGPISTLGLGYLGITVYNYIQEEKNKQFLKSSFGTYISPELIDQMYDSGQEPELGGEEGYHTAFFTDIQSFSAFSEKLSASDLVGLLNHYLTEMTNILMDNKGTLDKYIGDAIVAFYGAPMEVDDHELMACRTAIKMQKRLAELRGIWQDEGERWPEIVHHMQNRIGINTGPMVTGNMGSDSRMNYTMMGDTVNLAARLESSAKQYGIYIQISESTFNAVSEKIVFRALDFVRVMGKTEPVRVFELISEIGQEPEQYKKILPAFHEALELYFSQKWEKAIEAFKAADELEEMFPGRKTNPSRIYIPRCEHFMTNAPGDDWDGVWTLTSK